MRLTHLGLPVRDVRRSVAFYAAYFGFDPDTASRYEDGTVIIRNADRFDLALHEVTPDRTPPEADLGMIGPVDPFLHFGFRLPDPGTVRTLLSRLRADGVQIVESYDEPQIVAFKCADPDGHRVEAYWEA